MTTPVLWKYNESGVEGRRTEQENLNNDLVITFSSPNPWCKLLSISAPGWKDMGQCYMQKSAISLPTPQVNDKGEIKQYIHYLYSHFTMFLY